MRVGVEVVDDLLVSVDDLVEVLRRDLVLEPRGRHGDDALGAELIGVGQVAAEGLCVVGLVGDIRQDEDSRLRRELRQGRRPCGRG